MPWTEGIFWVWKPIWVMYVETWWIWLFISHSFYCFQPKFIVLHKISPDMAHCVKEISSWINFEVDCWSCRVICTWLFGVSCCINGPNHAWYGLQDRGAPQIKACLLLPRKACINTNLVCRELLGFFREVIYFKCNIWYKIILPLCSSLSFVELWIFFKTFPARVAENMQYRTCMYGLYRTYQALSFALLFYGWALGFAIELFSVE